MNATTPRAVGLVVLTAIVLAAAGPAAAYTSQELAGDAKITIDQARDRAESASGPDHRRGARTQRLRRRSLTYGNVEDSAAPGKSPSSHGLDGGAEGIRTDGHRGAGHTRRP
jgi:hypothetical protein